MATQAQHEFQILEPEKHTALVPVISREESIILQPVMNLQLAKQRLQEFQEFVKGYLVAGEDYGNIPGVSKPSLFKPGAEKLCELYGLADTYPEDKARRIENWDTGLFFYEFTCVLTKKGTDIVVGEGKGSCSTYESRYRYRDAARVCPDCGKAAIIKGKKEYGGGWLCFGKKGGCGNKWKDGDQAIEGQQTGKVENENLHDVINTVLKIAKKRSKVDAVIAATRSSGIFTQDVEDGAPADTPITEPRHAEGDVISGHITGATVIKGETMLKIENRQERYEKVCVIAKDRADIQNKLAGAQGKFVEVLVMRRKIQGSKELWQINGVMQVGEPQGEEFTANDEDIPF